MERYLTHPYASRLFGDFTGLDAYNTYNVVESLVSLSRNYNRTVVFTIHQPRSNIVALFDQLVLLVQSRLIYAREFSKCRPYFDSIGQHCPPGFNMTDYLIDITASFEKEPKGYGSSSTGMISLTGDVTASASLPDEERALPAPRHETHVSSDGQLPTPLMKPNYKYGATAMATVLRKAFYSARRRSLFFTLALFGFSCLLSLGLFANKRIFFMRERSNGYYSSFTYSTSTILFDILPLRVVPPLLFEGILYGLVGFVPTVAAFWKFILTLVLFNLTTVSVVLLISIACANTSVASLIGTMVMLFKSSPWLQWLHTVSFFHAAFEALAVNELRFLQLKEDKYGVELDVPAATILSTFGLRAQSFWWPNISLLGIFFVTFTAASFVVLHFFVRERR